MDNRGNLYGTALGGKLANGIVFKLSPMAGPSGNVWKETILHNFDGYDGNYPAGGVILDSVGNIYGTTGSGRQFRLWRGV